MANIVYVLSNPATPGLLKIGSTNEDSVENRMSDLYTTGVPCPFHCVIAQDIGGRPANALAEV